MHSQIFVTVNKDAALDTSEKARMYVSHYLADEGFATEDRFTSSYGDWFLIGGRWTGLLTDKQHDLLKIYGRPVLGKFKLGDLKIAYGHDDDAQVVTKELYVRFLKPFEEGAEGIYESDNSEGVLFREKTGGFLDVDYEEVSADFIGKKWLVLVDLHG